MPAYPRIPPLTKSTTRSKRLATVAYHEAGHAVAAFIRGIKTPKVTIVPEPGKSLGRLVWYLGRSFHPDLRRQPAHAQAR